MPASTRAPQGILTWAEIYRRTVDLPENCVTIVSNKMPNQIDPSEIRKRSVILDGHRTSVSLENAFWPDLKGFAANRRITVNQLITEIDRERTGNLSSAIRIYVLKQYHKPATIL